MLVLPAGAAMVAGVIGWPVRHSLSPALHGAAIAAAGLDMAYVAWEVPPGECEAALDQMRTDRIVGMSVTMPHKGAAAAACDELSPLAAALGAVNCVRQASGPGATGDPDAPTRLVGENTDGTGFVNWLATDFGVDPDGVDVVVIGAGGAGRAVTAALVCAGARVALVNRTHEVAEDVARTANLVASQLAGEGANDAAGTDASGEPHGRCDASRDVGDAIAGAQLIVNATPLGMNPSDPLPFDVAWLGPEHLVVDLIYHPAETALLVAAQEKAKKCANGTGMLLFQAAEQFTLWTGRPAAIDAMAVAVGLSQQLNPGDNPNAGNTFRTETRARK